MDRRNEIMSKYKNVYQEKDLPMSLTCMCWGLSIDDGWLDIIEQLSEFLDKPSIRLCEKFKMVDGSEKDIFISYPQVRFTQVKEKFGILRIYYDCYFKELEELDEMTIKLNQDVINKLYKMSMNYVDGAIGFAEYLSSITCEICGKRGDISKKDYWIKTLCEEHREELGYTKINGEL